MGVQWSKHHGYVVIVVTSIGLQCLLTGMMGPGRLRPKIFNKKFLTDNFGEQHQREIGKPEPSYEGYPDMGNGRYSAKLSYREWWLFNNAQRAHLNFLEQLGIAVPAIILGGIYYPAQAVCLGSCYFVGRLLYSVGYMSEGGADSREAGAYIAGFSLLGNIGFAIATGVKMVKTLPSTK
eukprot:TRINITY_DN2018_c0_g2_i1.p1 TRINITY_DN2018_c0_g2~~TRINITY_DN2018_c0_g2_i1.p1  ORF type:complete len:179 (+),score=30.14 TRINITY_DN2018_c0_g2_i1:102-638(+)